MARINKDSIDHWFEYGIDLQGRRLWLGSAQYEDDNESGVDGQMLERFTKGLYLLQRSGSVDQPIKIILSTYGGSLDDGMAIYSLIKQSRHHITVYGLGKVMSAGCLIMQAADERILDPWCITMFHKGTAEYPSDHPLIAEKWVEFNKLYRYPRIEEMMMERMREKKPELREKKFHEMNNFDTILTSEQAIEWGLADRITNEGELSE